MSTKRSTPSTPSPSNPTTSKLPKFLQKQPNRDRSKSVAETPDNSSITGSIIASTSTPSPELSHSSIPITKTRKTSKFLGIKEKEKDRIQSFGTPPTTNTTADETPVIVEPVNIPRPRTRSEHPAASAPDSLPLHSTSQQLYSSTSSTSRIGDLPTRLSGWFSHTFTSSSTDIPSLLAYHSPKGKGPSALLTAAKNGKGHLDKAMRYLLDSDATPDKCTDPIWLLGVQHPGYEPPLPALPNVVATSPSNNTAGGSLGLSFRRNSASPPSFRSSTSSAASSELSQSTNSSSSKIPNPAANWPPVFYIDFTSRIWLTYRSQFPLPIKDGRLADLCSTGGVGESHDDEDISAASSPTIVKSRPWNWVAVVGGEKTWTSDSGWGCMLRTGQSLLANALIHMHLGRDWRRPPYPVHTADYATYVQILTWFLDTPVQEAPFSVHRMALAGKDLGTDVGQWFGPSVAAGAIKTLVNSFPESGLAVSVASDSTLYQTHVFAASHGDMNVRSPHRRHAGSSVTTWGGRPVLLLLGIRLGIEGVNPIYYDTIKLLYTFPQSVGIAGGRPSSSYYFVGSQADNLFYLDPHNARPAIPLRPPPSGIMAGAAAAARDQDSSDPEREQGSSSLQQQQHQHRKQQQPPSSIPNNQRVPPSPSSTRTGSSNFSYHAPVSPSPLQHQFSSTGSSSVDTNSSSGYDHSYIHPYPHSRSPPPSYQQSDTRWRRSASTSAGSGSQPASPAVDTTTMDPRELGVFPTGAGAAAGGGSGDGDSAPNDGLRRGLDPIQLHYCTAYSAAELKTFHCERVRKMPMSGLDPSMLIGFLCRDEKDWWDFKKRVADLPRTIFSVQDEMPTWPSDSDDSMGLESISEPDDMDLDDEDEAAVGGDHQVEEEEEQEEEEEEGEVVELEVDSEPEGEGEEEGEGSSDKFFDTCSRSASTSSASAGSITHSHPPHRHRRHHHHPRHRYRKSDDVETEDEPVDPVTPGPTHSRFVVPPLRKEGGEDEYRPGGGGGGDDGDGDDDIEDDWVDPSLPSPTPTATRPRLLPKALQPDQVVSSSSSSPAAAPAPLVSNKTAKTTTTKPSSSKKSSSNPTTTTTTTTTRTTTTTTKKNNKKQLPVPVPSVKLPPSKEEHYYPFPVAPIDDQQQHSSTPPPPQHHHQHTAFQDRASDEQDVQQQQQGGGGSTSTTIEKRMHTARARDGGRTQSGGVKGILTDD